MKHPSRPHFRLMVIASVFVAVTLYVTLLSVLNVGVRSGDAVFGATVETPNRLDVHLELFDLDASRLTATLHVSVVPGTGIRGARATSPDKDLLLIIRVGDNVQDLAFPAQGRMGTVDLHVPIDTGSILRYPFDAYSSTMRWRAFEGTASARGPELPLRFHTYETSPLFDGSIRLAKTGSPGDLTLALEVHRPLVIRWFASAIYLSMAAVGVSAVTIGFLLFTRSRRIEATLVGALCAMMFAIPAMRNTLPGGPPLGVAGDLMIFLWAELAVVFGLVLGVVTWIRDGVRPPPPAISPEVEATIDEKAVGGSRTEVSDTERTVQQAPSGRRRPIGSGR